jgi:hypothetical protein
VWVFLQTWVFAPVVLGQQVFEDLVHAPWYGFLFSAVLVAWLSFALVRNLWRLWRAPVDEASKWHVAPLLAVGLLSCLLSSGPLLEGERASTKPVGLVAAVIGINVTALAVREVLRLWRANRSTPAMQQPQVGT